MKDEVDTIPAKIEFVMVEPCMFMSHRYPPAYLA